MKAYPFVAAFIKEALKNTPKCAICGGLLHKSSISIDHINRKDDGGLDVDDIHTKKGLEVGQKIFDYMGSTELVANLFRISQTEEKLRKDEVDNAKTATSVHYSVGREVRTAIEKIGGTMPEDLPTPEKSIQQIEKEQTARLKAKAKKGKLMLDE